MQLTLLRQRWHQTHSQWTHNFYTQISDLTQTKISVLQQVFQHIWNDTTFYNNNTELNHERWTHGHKNCTNPSLIVEVPHNPYICVYLIFRTTEQNLKYWRSFKQNMYNIWSLGYNSQCWDWRTTVIINSF